MNDAHGTFDPKWSLAVEALQEINRLLRSYAAQHGGHFPSDLKGLLQDSNADRLQFYTIGDEPARLEWRYASGRTDGDGNEILLLSEESDGLYLVLYATGGFDFVDDATLKRSLDEPMPVEKRISSSEIEMRIRNSGELRDVR